MRNLNLRKQLKTFGKGLLRGATAVVTAGASEGPNIGKKIYETYQSYNEKPKFVNKDGNKDLLRKTLLPSMVKADPTPTGLKNTSKKLEGAYGSMHKKLEKFPATSTNAKPAGVKSVKTKTPSPKISKAKPTVNEKASSKKVKTKIKTNKRGVVKIKTKIK